MDPTDKLEQVRATALQHFSGLTASALNWKPEPSRWSIAQCLDHLITSNRTYYPTFKSLLEGRYRLGFLQRFNPFKKTFGPMMIKSLGPVPSKKFKAPKIFEPAASEISSDIVQRFGEHQQELKTFFQQLQQLDTEKLVIASPVSGMITYSLSDALKILAGHEERHLNQALNVLNHPNFPKS